MHTHRNMVQTTRLAETIPNMFSDFFCDQYLRSYMNISLSREREKVCICVYVREISERKNIKSECRGHTNDVEKIVLVFLQPNMANKPTQFFSSCGDQLSVRYDGHSDIFGILVVCVCVSVQGREREKTLFRACRSHRTHSKIIFGSFTSETARKTMSEFFEVWDDILDQLWPDPSLVCVPHWRERAKVRNTKIAVTRQIIGPRCSKLVRWDRNHAGQKSFLILGCFLHFE